MEDIPIGLNDKDRKAYKQYSSAVLDALRAFDKAAEWPALVKYLRELGTVIEKHNKRFASVPERLFVSKRLAQCLNPMLPAGVHVEALTIMDTIFSTLGASQLAENLHYSLGLFPLFGNGSIQVKWKIIGLIDRHYLPLGLQLLPCLQGLVLALLPGIAEVNSEFYPRVMTLLDTISKIDNAAFVQAIWIAVLRSPDVRIPALHWLRVHVPAPPQLHSGPEAESAWLTDLHTNYLPDKETLVLRALSASLQDRAELVQRETLELIVTIFKLKFGIFSGECLPELVVSSLMLLTRREMSLNRRVFAWLLGTDGKSSTSASASEIPETPAEYFKAHGLHTTLVAMREIFKKAYSATSASEALLPVKILNCLVDRDEIGLQIIDNVIVDVLQLLSSFREGQPSHEVIKGCKEFLDIVAIDTLWSFIDRWMRESLVCEAGKYAGSKAETCVGLFGSFLDVVSPAGQDQQCQEDYVLVITKHLPRVLAALLESLANVQTSPEALLRLAQLALKVMGKIPGRETLGTNNPAVVTTSSVDTTTASSSLDRGALKASSEHSRPAADIKILDSCLATFSSFFTSFVSSTEIFKGEERPETERQIFDMLSRLLHELHSRYMLLDFTAEGSSSSTRAPPQWFPSMLQCCQAECPSIATAAIKSNMLLASQKNPIAFEYWSSIITKDVLHQLVVKLWSLLTRNCSSVHYEVARLMVEAEHINENCVFEEIADKMASQNMTERVESIQRFALLWRLAGDTVGAANSRPFTRELYLMLDTLQSDHPTLRLTGRSWLANALGKVERILDPLLRDLLDTTTIRCNGIYQRVYDTRRILYIFKLLRVLVEGDLRLFLVNVSGKAVSKDVSNLNEIHCSVTEDAPAQNVDAPSMQQSAVASNYLYLTMAICLRFIQGTVPDKSPSDFSIANGVVQNTAAELLQYLLKITEQREAKVFSCFIQQTVLHLLASAVSAENLVLQVHLLSILRTIVQLDSIKLDTSSVAGGTAVASSVSENPMFIQTLIAGILQPVRNVRPYWLEFIATTMPLIGSLPQVTGAVIECLCGVIEYFPQSEMYNSIPAEEISAALRTMDTVLSFVTSNKTPGGESPAQPQAMSTAAPSIFLNPWMGVIPLSFASNTRERSASTASPATTLRGSILAEKLPQILFSMLTVYGASKLTLAADKDAEVHNKYYLQDLVFQMLEPLMKRYPADFITALLAVWGQDKAIKSTWGLRDVSIEVLNTMEAATEEVIISACCEILSPSILARQPSKGDALVLEFMSQYVAQCVNLDLLAASWPQFFPLMKNVMNVIWSSDTVTLIMRIIKDYLMRVSALEDKRGKKINKDLRRERQELVQKLVELLPAILLAPRMVPQTFSQSPAPGGQSVANAPSSGGDSSSTQPQPAGGQKPSPVSSPSRTSVSFPKDQPPPMEDDLGFDMSSAVVLQLPPDTTLDVLRSLTSLILPLLDSVFVDDREKLVSVLGTLVHCLVPLIRSCWAQKEICAAIAQFFASSCTYPYASRAWRKEVWDLFHDIEFFSQGEATLSVWEAPVNVILNTPNDKFNFSDLIKSVTKSLQPSQTLLWSRDESVSRARHIKRMAFMILSGDKDQYVKQLPDIRERVVDAIKISANAPVLQVQIFNCLRVMYLKFSSNLIQALWPVVITELTSALFLPLEGDTAQVVLAAAKLADLVVTIPDATFSLHQWMFIRERARQKEGLAYLPLFERVSQQDANASSSTQQPENAGAADDFQPPTPSFKQRTIITASTLPDPTAIKQLRRLLREYNVLFYSSEVRSLPTDMDFIVNQLLNDLSL